MSVIIRAKDGVAVLGRAIASVREQSVPAEIVVVDSGSTDGGRELAECLADRVVAINPDDFTFGRALNVGAGVASAEYHVALSSHCALPHAGWLARCLELLEEDHVGAAAGKMFTPSGQCLDGTVYQDVETLRADPLWTMSNHASGWRAQAWRTCPFDETLQASEDRVFAHRIAAQGWRIALDPQLWVPPGHRADAGYRSLYERRRREVAASATALGLPPFRPADALRWWWQDVPRRRTASKTLARLNPRRVVALAGTVAGHRDAERRCRSRGRDTD